VLKESTADSSMNSVMTIFFILVRLNQLGYCES